MNRTMVTSIIKLTLGLATILALYLVSGVTGIDPRCRNVQCSRLSSNPGCEHSVDYMFEQANRIMVNHRIHNWCCCNKGSIRGGLEQRRKRKIHALKRCFKEIMHNLAHPPFEFPADECCPTVLFNNFPICKNSPFKSILKPDNQSTSTTKSPTSTTTTGQPKEKKSSGKGGDTTTITTKAPSDKKITTTTTKGPAKSTTTTKSPGKGTTTTKAATTIVTDNGKSKDSSKGDDDDDDDGEV